MRTTLDIDGPILQELKVRAKRERKSLGRLTSDLLAQALSAVEAPAKIAPFDAWIVRPMGARVDLSDSEALYSAMDRDPFPSSRVAEEK